MLGEPGLEGVPFVGKGHRSPGRRRLCRRLTLERGGEWERFVVRDDFRFRVVGGGQSQPAGRFVADQRIDARQRPPVAIAFRQRSEEHTSELQSLMRISYAVFCLKKKKNNNKTTPP